MRVPCSLSLQFAKALECCFYYLRVKISSRKLKFCTNPPYAPCSRTQSIWPVPKETSQLPCRGMPPAALPRLPRPEAASALLGAAWMHWWRVKWKLGFLQLLPRALGACMASCNKTLYTHTHKSGRVWRYIYRMGTFKIKGLLKKSPTNEPAHSYVRRTKKTRKSHN